MGFDVYIAQDNYGDELEKEDHNEDNYLTNTHFMKLLKKQMDEAGEQPVFLWGITIESHKPYVNKYAETDIETRCEVLPDNALTELNNYIQSVKRTDEFVEELLEYVESRERPTLVVMYGDHRPPLEAFGLLGADSTKEQYSTVWMTYANYETTEMNREGISISYIPAWIAENSGLDSPFYRYLNRMRREYPILSDVFQSPEFSEKRKEYEMLQYDIMFGEGHVQ